MLLQNSFNGGTNGSTITTGNSGGTSGNAFDFVGGTATYSNAHATGTRAPMACSLADGADISYDLPALAASTLYMRMYAWFTGNPSSSVDVMFSMTDFVIVLERDTAGKLLLTDNGANIVITSTNSVALNQWVRIELKVVFGTTATNGSAEVRLYNNADSTTATETKTVTSVDTRTIPAYVDWVGSVAGGMHIDDIALTDVDWLGPAGVTDTPKTSTDTASLAEAARIGQDRTDTATLTEAPAIDAAAARTDQATLVEASSVGPTTTDQAGLSEQAAIATALSAADTATLAEVSAPAPILNRTDTASLSETVGLAPSVAGSDTAGLVEQTPVIDLTSSDTAGLVEQTPVKDETTGPATADTAYLVELSGITADPAATDTADLAELSAVDVLRFGTDTATLAEASTLSLPTTDTAGLAETATVVATLDRVDIADLFELSDAVQPLTTFDVATLLEQAVVINLGRDVTAAGPPYTRWRASTPYT